MKLNNIKYIALNLTHKCNLRCAYCYAGDKTGETMTAETAFQSIDFINRECDNHATVTFFGGEPLLEFELMKTVVEYTEQNYNGKINFRLSTNGTRLNEEMLRWFGKHKIFFTLSLDGSREQQNRGRRTAGDKNSYDSVAGSVDSILAFNPYTMVVSVIYPETVDQLAAGVKHLFSLGFRYVLQTLDYSNNWESGHIKELKNQYEELSRFYFDSLKSGKKIYYSPFDERIKTHAQKPYGKGDLCDIGNTQIAIAPSGIIYPCVQFVGNDTTNERVNSLGSVHSGFDDKKRHEVVELNYSDRQECSGCALDGRCANYCGCVNWKSTGSIKTIPPIICEHERMLMPIVDRLGNKLWKQNVSLFKDKFYNPYYPVSSYIEDCMVNCNENT